MSKAKNSCFQGVAMPGGYEDITVDQLSALAAEVKIIDVRESSEFEGELGHLQGAELCPLSIVEESAAHWDKDGPRLMVCRSGNRSGQAAAILVKLGFTQIGNLSGGMLAVRLSKEAKP